MGGNKNNISGQSANGSQLTAEEDTKMTTNNNRRNDNDDDNFVTIRINRSHLYGAGCALFGALSEFFSFCYITIVAKSLR